MPSGLARPELVVAQGIHCGDPVEVGRLRVDEFDAGLSLLPERLAVRVMALRQPATTRSRCPVCREVRRRVEMVFAAARHDELAVAADGVGVAERLVWDSAGQHTEHGPWAAGLHGHVRGWGSGGRPPVFATDASVKDRIIGLGYVASDGRWGLAARTINRGDHPVGCCRVLLGELDAVGFLLGAVGVDPGELVVMVDSRTALGYLRRWQAGAVTDMPAGYPGRRTVGGDEPALARLAQRVVRLPGVGFRPVKGHVGHPLNEAADALASMARRRRRERFDVTVRAADLVTEFLRDWDGGPDG